MNQPISEAELIELERRIARYMGKIEDYILARIETTIEPPPALDVLPEYIDAVEADIDRLIDQARGGQLCCECGARIEPTGITESVNHQRQGIADSKGNP